MCVPGAMTATSAAMVRMNPADAARAPDGPTNTTTGARDVISRETMSRVESSRPPGVRRTMTTTSAPRASAWVIASIDVLGGDGMDDAVEFGDDGEAASGRGARRLSELKRRPEAQADEHGDSNPRHAHILSTVATGEAM